MLNGDWYGERQEVDRARVYNPTVLEPDACTDRGETVS